MINKCLNSIEAKFCERIPIREAIRAPSVQNFHIFRSILFNYRLQFSWNVVLRTMYRREKWGLKFFRKVRSSRNQLERSPPRAHFLRAALRPCKGFRNPRQGKYRTSTSSVIFRDPVLLRAPTYRRPISPENTETNF